MTYTEQELAALKAAIALMRAGWEAATHHIEARTEKPPCSLTRPT